MSTVPTAPASVGPKHRSPRDLSQHENLTVPQVFEWNAKENPDLHLFRYHDGLKLNTITNAQAIRAIRRVARYINSCIGTTLGCIAIIANAGMLNVLRLP